MTRTRISRSVALAVAIAALAAPTAGARQDLRSPDAQDAATRYAQPSQDLRSPDARDAADAAGTPEVTVVEVAQPATSSGGGIDWGDVGIGAGGLFGLILVSLGGTLVVKHRRRQDITRGPATVA